MRSVHVPDAVVTGELFVDEREVRREQIEDASVLFQLSIKEQLHLLDERDAQVVVKPWKMLVCIRREKPHVAGLEPLLEEIPHECGSSPRSREHAPHLLIEHAGIVKLLANRQVEQFVIRDAAPEEE